MKTPFDEDFETQQQQIRQLHLKLETQMQHFLAFIQQCQDNRSMLVYSPPEPPPHPAARHSRVKIFRYFLTVCCAPATPGGPWHHRIRSTHPQHLRTYTTNMNTPHSTTRTTANIGRTHRNAEHSTAPVVSIPSNTRSATRPTAPTEPPYDDTISTKETRGLETRPLPGPMISYCPPWPPPHRKCWYSTNVDLHLRRSQHQSYTTHRDATQYYR